MSLRRERVAESLKQEISDILRSMKDPRVGMASVVRVEVSRDVRFARVFVSVYGADEERRRSFEALRRAAGYVRSELSARIRLRYTPEIDFRLDDSIVHGAHIASLLRDLRDAGSGPEEDRPQEPGPDRVGEPPGREEDQSRDG